METIRNEQQQLEDIAKDVLDEIKKDSEINPLTEKPIEAEPTETDNDTTPLQELYEAVIITSKEKHAMRSKTLETREIPESVYRDAMPDLSDDVFQKEKNALNREIEEVRKSLIIAEGFTAEEADAAAMARIRKKGERINREYLKEHPSVGIIEINATDREKLELTKEEREKLSTTKEIKLILKEEKALEAIPIKNVDKKSKAKYIAGLTGAIARYGLPLPVLGDFVTFKGCTTMQLISLVEDESDTPLSTFRKKCQLIYDRLIGGTAYKKYDENKNVLLSYDDFMKSFRFHDLDLALYGVICASTSETSEATFTCGQCEKEYQYQYSMKSLLKLESISEDYKEIINKIDQNRNNSELLESMIEQSGIGVRFRSTETNNIYDITFPSLLKADRIFAFMDLADPTQFYYAIIATFLDNVYLYDKEENNYLQINTMEEVDHLMDILPELPEKEISILVSQLDNKIFNPQFAIKTKCPHCGSETETDIDITKMVFLKAQDSATAIKA